MDIEIFEVDGGFGYRVGAIYQPCRPDKPGFEPMSREEAEQCAAAVAERVST